MAKIVVFVGTIRRERHALVVASWVRGVLERRGHVVTVLDPLDHVELSSFTDQFKTTVAPSDDFVWVRSVVAGADGYVLITPEYNHSYAGTLKNALDCFLEEYYFKPFGIVTYSAGPFGGIRAAEHLRGVCAELGAPAIPLSLALSGVQRLFDDRGVLVDLSYVPRLDRMLDEFLWYVSALGAQRLLGTPY